jgi:DDE family transposase
VSADLDALLVHVYVLVDDLLPPRRRLGRPPLISDSELICLAVAQVLLDCPNERRFLRLAKRRLGHLFPYIPGQAGFNKRLRALAPQLLEAITILARLSPSFRDRLRLLDSTPVPCAASRETVRRSALAGHAGYGYCRSHSRWFWGFRLYLLCAPDGLPVGFELAAANQPERVIAAELLERTLNAGQTVIADKGFAGREFEQLVASLGGQLLRPDRKDEPARFGSLGGIRQWIESCFDTLKDQLSLERHGGRTLTGLVSRIARRLLALAAAILHNSQTDQAAA